MGIALSVASLQWALGVFLAAAGAMMLVAPHQFGEPGYDALRRHLPWWGVSFCCAGAGLLAARCSPCPAGSCWPSILPPEKEGHPTNGTGSAGGCLSGAATTFRTGRGYAAGQERNSPRGVLRPLAPPGLPARRERLHPWASNRNEFSKFPRNRAFLVLSRM